MTLPPWPLPGAQVQTPAPPLPSCFTSKSPQGSGSKTPTHAAIKYPLLRPETTGFYCLSVLGPNVPTQDVTGPRSLQRLQGESFPGIPRPLACGHIRAVSASTDRGLSLRLRPSSSLCVCLHRRESGRTSAVWVFWCFPHDRTEGCALLILLSHCSSQLTSPPSPGGDAGQVPALGSPRPPSPQHTDTLKGSLARPLGAILGASAGEAFFLSRCLCSVPYISVEVWVFLSYFGV